MPIPLSVFQIIGPIFAILALLVTGYLKTSKFDAQWQQYRFIVEQLRKERTYLEMKIGEYGDLPEDVQQRMFIDRVESILAGELSRYFAGERRAE